MPARKIESRESYSSGSFNKFKESISQLFREEYLLKPERFLDYTKDPTEDEKHKLADKDTISRAAKRLQAHISSLSAPNTENADKILDGVKDESELSIPMLVLAWIKYMEMANDERKSGIYAKFIATHKRSTLNTTELVGRIRADIIITQITGLHEIKIMAEAITNPAPNIEAINTTWSALEEKLKELSQKHPAREQAQCLRQQVASLEAKIKATTEETQREEKKALITLREFIFPWPKESEGTSRIPVEIGATNPALEEKVQQIFKARRKEAIRVAEELCSAIIPTLCSESDSVTTLPVPDTSNTTDEDANDAASMIRHRINELTSHKNNIESVRPTLLFNLGKLTRYLCHKQLSLRSNTDDAETLSVVTREHLEKLQALNAAEAELLHAITLTDTITRMINSDDKKFWEIIIPEMYEKFTKEMA